MARFFAFLFAAFACVATSASAQSFNAQEQAEIRAIVRDYLVDNPDVLQEALDALQARVEARRRDRIESDSRDFSMGPANAPIVIVEFFDYRCPHCHRALDWVNDIVRTRRDVRVVFKELPILTEASVEASRAAIAAMPQGRYLQFHRELMAFTGDLTSEHIDTLARRAGIDVARMRRAMADPATNERITQIIADNRGLAIDLAGGDPNSVGTPLFMINGRVANGFRAEEVTAMLRDATREARRGRAS